jgi:hypothetical protein
MYFTESVDIESSSQAVTKTDFNPLSVVLSISKYSDLCILSVIFYVLTIIQ